MELDFARARTVWSITSHAHQSLGFRRMVFVMMMVNRYCPESVLYVLPYELLFLLFNQLMFCAWRYDSADAMLLAPIASTVDKQEPELPQDTQAATHGSSQQVTPPSNDQPVLQESLSTSDNQAVQKKRCVIA
jgi:hypothetical protein